MGSIAGWARAHPTEVVIVDFQHVCYDNSPDANADDELWSELAPLGTVTYDPTGAAPVGSATIDDVVHPGGGVHNVILLLPADVLRPADLLTHFGVHATFTVQPGAGVGPGVPSPSVPEEYSWPSHVGPTSVAGEDSADSALASYPTTVSPALGSLAGAGFYQSQLIYSLGSANEIAALTTFGGLIPSHAQAGTAEPAWEAGLWDASPDRNAVVARWGRRLNVVVTDDVEQAGFVAAVVEQNAAAASSP